MKRIVLLTLAFIIFIVFVGATSVFIGRASRTSIYANKKTTFPDFGATYGKGADCIVWKRARLTTIRCLSPGLPNDVVAYDPGKLGACGMKNGLWECNFFLLRNAEIPFICGIWMGSLKLADPHIKLIRISIDCGERAVTVFSGYAIN